MRSTPVSEIARRADVSEGALYSYFPTKQALLEAVGEAYGRGLAEAAFGALEGELSPAVVRRVVENIFRYVRESDGPLAAFLLAGRPEEGGPAQSANRAQMLAAIESALCRGIDQGVVAPCDVRVAAELQFGLVESALRDCFLRRRGVGQAATIREVVRCLRAYLTAPSLLGDGEGATEASEAPSIGAFGKR